MLDPHRLRVFRAVVASGGVQAAADTMAMTSSAVSQHLAALSRETGLTLFRREGRRIVPTEVALALDRESDEVMTRWARLERVVIDLREGRTGRLVIGYFPSAGSAWMPELATRLSAELPGMTLELVLSDAETARVDLDLVISPREEPAPAGYRRVPLTQDPFVAVVPSGHRLAGRSEVSMADLRGETFVSNDLPRSVGHRIVVAACTAAGFRPRFPVQAQDSRTAFGFVSAGIGITIAPSLAVQALPPGVVRVPIEPAPVRYLAALVRDHGAPTPAADRAVQLLAELIARPADSSRSGQSRPRRHGLPQTPHLRG